MDGHALEGAVNFEKTAPLKNKTERLARKKEGLRLTNADWAPVYDGLTSEIRLRYYSPKTLKSYQEQPGHSDVRTTMVYTHTLRSRTIKEAESPLNFHGLDV